MADNRFSTRLSEELYEQLLASANHNRRSLSDEAALRLERSIVEEFQDRSNWVSVPRPDAGLHENVHPGSPPSQAGAPLDAIGVAQEDIPAGGTGKISIPAPSPQKRQTSGAPAGMCIHRVSLGAFCGRCV